jgi:hypothetical protein
MLSCTTEGELPGDSHATPINRDVAVYWRGEKLAAAAHPKEAEQSHIHFEPPAWSWRHVPLAVRRWLLAGIGVGVGLQAIVLYRQGVAALTGAFTSLDALLTVAASVAPGLIYYAAVRGINVGFSARVPHRVDAAVGAIEKACARRSLRASAPLPAGLRGRGRKVSVGDHGFVLVVVPERKGSLIRARRITPKNEAVIQELLNEIDWALQHTMPASGS